MRTENISRRIGMVVLGILGGSLGAAWGRTIDGNIPFYVVLLGAVGALAGLILTPMFTVRPLRRIRKALVQLSVQTLLAVFLGMLAGLAVAALVYFSLIYGLDRQDRFEVTIISITWLALLINGTLFSFIFSRKLKAA